MENINRMWSEKEYSADREGTEERKIVDGVEAGVPKLESGICVVLWVSFHDDSAEEARRVNSLMNPGSREIFLEQCSGTPQVKR